MLSLHCNIAAIHILKFGEYMLNIDSAKFEPTDFAVSEADFLQLNDVRPLGLSGHMRVRDEALTLRASLDSCLPFLDELIVTYNDSSDDTEAILQEYAIKYPHKIRLFWYPLEWGPCRGEMQMRPYGHLAQFYNFGYTKIRYAFYMKIDADQIYFTKKMLFIRDIILEQAKRLQLGEDVQLTMQHTASPYAFYEKIIVNALSKHGMVTFTLGGIEACYKNHDFYIYSLENLDEGVLFNGIFNDHFIIKPTAKQRYHMQGDYFEVFPHTQSHCVALGLHWVHLGSIKRKINRPHSDVITLQKAHKFTWENVYKLINTKATNDIVLHNHYKNWGRRFWDKDVQTFLTNSFYEQYFAKLLPIVRAHYAQ